MTVSSSIIQARRKNYEATNIPAFPPSSKVTFFFPDSALSFQPTAALPVKERTLILESMLKGAACSVKQGKIENAPSGNPALDKMSPKMEAEIGVMSDGFKTNGQPAAIAGPTLCA